MNLSEIKVPSWLSIHRHAEEIMGRIDPITTDPIPTAMLPPPSGEVPLPVQTQQAESTEADLSTPPVLLMSDHLQQLAMSAKEHETDKARWVEVIEQAKDRIKDLARENGFVKLELAQKTNDVQTLQAMVYDLQQRIAEQAIGYEKRIAELEALASQCHALVLHAAARYEDAKIPLSVRKRVRNGKTNEASHAEKPVDRPTIQSDQAA